MSENEAPEHGGRSAVVHRPRTRSVDVAVSPRERDMFESLVTSWEAQVGKSIPIPPSTPTGEGDYRIRIRHSDVGDAVVEDLYSESIVGGTGGDFNHLNDRVVIHVGRRGTWHFGRSNGSGGAMEMSGGGRFVARLNDPSWDFGIGPRTRTTVLILPTAEFPTLRAEKAVVGTVATMEMRLLMAHVAMVQDTLDGLSEDGVTAARNAMMELARGVLAGGGLDAGEPGFAPALADAARLTAERLLTDPELSPEVVALHLNVSARTLQRAFAGTGESFASFIRRRRLERALQDLTAPGPRPSVSELAARYQFADSSHFIRAFKRAYGHSPGRWARHGGEPGAPAPTEDLSAL